MFLQLRAGADPVITGGGGSRASVASDIFGGSGGYIPLDFFYSNGLRYRYLEFDVTFKKL